MVFAFFLWVKCNICFVHRWTCKQSTLFRGLGFTVDISGRKKAGGFDFLLSECYFFCVGFPRWIFKEDC